MKLMVAGGTAVQCEHAMSKQWNQRYFEKQIQRKEARKEEREQLSTSCAVAVCASDREVLDGRCACLTHGASAV